jgi:hypothetical protein
MDTSGAEFTGAPSEEWPRILAAALVMEVSDSPSGELEVALPDDQAGAVLEQIESIAEGATGLVRVTRALHREGWTRLRLVVSE